MKRDERTTRQATTGHEPLQVLLVEDEASLRGPLARHLRDKYCYHVDAAASAAEAWQLVAAASRPYDVALIDDLLTPEPGAEPEPIGIPLMAEIRERCPETECIVFTGWGMDRALAALQAGAYRYLAKPLNLDELDMTMRMAAGQAQLRHERDLLSTILKISNAMVRRPDVDQTLEVIVEAMPKLVGAEGCAVALEDPATGRVRHQTKTLIGDPAVRWQRHMKQILLTRQIIESNQAFLMSDVDAHAGQVDEGLRRTGIRSFVGVPIPDEPRSQGVLYAYSTRQNAFGPYERDILTLLANQVAIALQTARLFEAETRRRQEAETLQELGVALNASLKLEEVLDRVAKSCQHLIQAETSTALVYDQRREKYVQRGVSDNLSRPIIVREPRPVGFTRHVLETGQTLVIPDLARDERARPDHLELGIRSMAAVPIQLADQVIGVLFVHSSAPQRFDSHQVALLSVLANQAAIAIANAQYVDENVRRMKELEHLHQAAEKLAGVANVRDVLQQIVRSAREVLSADSAAIWSYDDIRHTFLPDELVADGIQAELVGRFREDEPHQGGTAEIVMEQSYLAVPNIEDPAYAFLGPTSRGLRGAIGVKAFQGIALRAGDEALGVLYVNYRQPRSFGSADRATLETFAYHAALTLKKARLLDQVRKARDVARIVAEVSVLEDLPGTLSSVARGTRHALDCDAVTLYTYDQNCQEFQFPPTMSGVRDPDPVLKPGMVTKESVVRRILALEKAHVAEDAPSDPLMSGPYVMREEIKSSVGIPLQVGDHKVGVMFVNYRSRHRFTGEELTTIELFAHQAAIAIENARLYQAERQRAEELAGLHRISQSIRSLTSMYQVYKQVNESIAGLVGAQMCGVLLYNQAEQALVCQLPMYGVSDEIGRRYRIPVGDGLPTHVLWKREHSLILNDVLQHPLITMFGLKDLAEESGLRDTLFAKLTTGNRDIGVIQASNKPDGTPFDEDDARLLGIFAGQAAAVIENARLYEELKRSKGIIGARTALAWIGMASSAWRHAIDKHALTIRELAQLLRQDWARASPCPPDTRVSEWIDTIERLATRILDKSITPPLSTEAGLELVSISALIGERARQLWQNAPYKGTELQLALELPESAAVRANPEWLRRAFDTLVDNAVQAVADRPRKEITIGSRPARDGAEILVSDTGPGIPEEIREKIGLERIEKPQDAEGLGMGLLMAQTIVQTYGGEIRVAFTGPAGTTMAIWLPMEDNLTLEDDVSERGPQP